MVMTCHSNNLCDRGGVFDKFPHLLIITKTIDMKSKELSTIGKRLEELELQLRDDYGLTKISGGFVRVDMFDYDDEFIHITIKDGVQSDCTDRVNYEEQKLDRKTLEFNN